MIAVHLYGFPCKIDEIKRVCKKFKIILIEDAAEAVGSKYKGRHLGTFGEAGVLSFNGNKPITCGSGGMIITNKKNLAFFTKHLSTHAKKKIPLDHQHDKVGYNYRMTNLSAAVGCAQMEKIGKIIKLKRKNYSMYSKNFKNDINFHILKEPKQSKSNYWLILGSLPNKKIKDEFLKYARKNGFICRPVWRPLHTLKIFKSFPKDDLECSKKIFNQTFSLPSSPSISN